MILAPVVSVAGNLIAAPVTLRLIGTLDRVLIESFSDACAGLAAPGGRTLIVNVRDLTVLRDENLDRFFALLQAYEAAGHRVCVDGTPAWRRISTARGASFAASSAVDVRTTRRQVIICHSVDKRAGAA